MSGDQAIDTIDERGDTTRAFSVEDADADGMAVRKSALRLMAAGTGEAFVTGRDGVTKELSS